MGVARARQAGAPRPAHSRRRSRATGFAAAPRSGGSAPRRSTASRRPGCPCSARWIQRRSRAGIGSSWSILPVSTTRSRGPLGDLAELALAPAAVVLDVDEDAGPRAHLPREHQVHEVLQRRQALALAPDERAELLALVAVAEDVEPARLAGLDVDRGRRTRCGARSCSRITLPAASASGDASAASSSARSVATRAAGGRRPRPPRGRGRSSSRAGRGAGRRGAPGRGRTSSAAGRGDLAVAGRRRSRGAAVAAAAVGRVRSRGAGPRRAVVAPRAAVADRGAGRDQPPRSSRRGPRSRRRGRHARRSPAAVRRAVALARRQAGSGRAAAASRFGAAPPSSLRGAARMRAGSAPMPRTPRLPGVRISKSRSSRPTPNASRALRGPPRRTCR